MIRMIPRLRVPSLTNALPGGKQPPVLARLVHAPALISAEIEHYPGEDAGCAVAGSSGNAVSRLPSRRRSW